MHQIAPLLFVRLQIYTKNLTQTSFLHFPPLLIHVQGLSLMDQAVSDAVGWVAVLENRLAVRHRQCREEIKAGAAGPASRIRDER